MAGIHASVANQKKKPLANHSRALRTATEGGRGQSTVPCVRRRKSIPPVRANQRSGASAKRQSIFSPIGGKLAQSKNPGMSLMSQNDFLSRLRIITR